MNNNLQIKRNFNLCFISVSIILACSTLLSPMKVNANINVNPLSQIVKENKVSLNINNKPINIILSEIQRQTKVDFGFSNAVNPKLMGNFSINVRNVTIEEALNTLFKDTDYRYTISGNKIIIDKKPIQSESQAKKPIYIKGKIIGEDKAPIMGATVIISGTSNGVISDSKGNFALTMNAGQQLEVSFIGYKPLKKVINTSDDNVLLTLKTSVMQVDDVVVTGYQVIDKRMSTSSVVSLNAKDVVEPVGLSLDQMLQGKVAGMSVMNQSSTVGAAPKIRIRGSSSIIGNREPVWVVDGVVLDDPIPLDPTVLNSLDRVNLIGNAISNLNPEDIERIDVLKDASATAIYGVKAANGVIVITTKRGKFGPASIRYSTSLNVLERPQASKMYLMNSEERINVSEEMHMRGLEYQGYSPRGVGYEGALQDLWDGHITSEQFNLQVQKLKNTNTDWYKELFRNSFSHSHTLSVSGATDVVNYYFSLGYSNQIGTPIHEKSNRLNFMSNIDIKISKRISARFSLGSSTSEDKRPHSSIDLNKYAYSTSRAISLYNEDGSLAYYDQDKGYNGTPNLVYNIMNELNTTGQSQKQQGYNANVNLNVNIAKWLDWSTILSYNTMTSKDESYITEKSYNAASKRKTIYGYVFPITNNDNYKNYRERDCHLPQGGILEAEDMISSTYNARTSLNFNKTIANVHSLSASAGVEIRSSLYNGTMNETWGYLPERGKKVAEIDTKVWVAYGNDQKKRVPKFTDTKTNTMSYYGTVSYAYDNRYVVSANVRGDASNKLGMDKTARFLPIWSFSGRWNIEQENFMEDVSWINGLSIRSSYGIQGNVTDAHNPNLLVSIGAKDSKSEEYISTVAALPNKGLLWEKTNSFNIGLDFSILNGIIRGSFEYYTKKGRDQLISAQVAPTNGGNIVTINAGDITNNGWEVSLLTTPVQTRDFTWGLNFNISKNNNRVTNQGEVPYTYRDYTTGSIIRNGRAVNSFYSYRYAGLDNTGFPKFNGIDPYDENGNVITSKDRAFANVFTYSGKREADLTGGITTSLRYKFISVSALFSVSLGSKIRLNRLFESDNFKLPYPQQNMQVEFVDRWRKPGDEAFTDIPALTDRVATNNSDSNMAMKDAYSSAWQMYNNSDLRVVSGNFLRCRSLSLSVAIPSSFTNKFYCSGASLSFGVSNPFVIKSKALKGRDPEQTELGMGALPPLRTYSMSLSLSF